MYNEALERARKLKEMYPQDAPGYEEVFPELAESEDERIRVRDFMMKQFFRPISPALADALADAIIKIEKTALNKKQKESLHITESCKENADSFTDEDERIRKMCIAAVNIAASADGGLLHSEASECLAWLEEQKDMNCLACDQHLKGYIAGRKATEEEKQKEQKHPTLDDPDIYGDWDKDLLDEIHSWLGHLDGKYTPYTIDDIKLTARHFVEWQKQQDLAEMAQSKSPLSVAYANRCFENGKQAMKVLMLKDAVEANVNTYENIPGGSYVEFVADIPASHFKEKGKVRIVVLKEEEE